MLFPLRQAFQQSSRFGSAYMSKQIHHANAAQPSASRSSFSSINVTFLGTASAQPSSTRNHSALALHLGRDVWIFDCGEATQHQLQKSVVKMGKIEKIFITHTHGEYCYHCTTSVRRLTSIRRPYFWFNTFISQFYERRWRYS